MKRYLLAATAALSFASAAQAATDLTSAMVTGPSGTIWNTNSGDTFYTVFLQRPIGTLLNPNDNFSGSATTEGGNNFTIAGDGFPSGNALNSDSTYRLTLSFADGATITGDYTFGAGPNSGGVFSNGTTATVGNSTYTLTGFGWDRSRADNVSPFRAVSGGDPFDYTGQFSYSAMTALGAVPEPATWAMLLLGFGVMGGAMRTRARQSRDARLMLRLA